MHGHKNILRKLSYVIRQLHSTIVYHIWTTTRIVVEAWPVGQFHKLFISLISYVKEKGSPHGEIWCWENIDEIDHIC